MRQDHGSRDHAIFAPSAAERWINCPDSIRAQEGMADIQSDSAKEGTECHEAASAILEGTDFDRATRGLTNEQILLIEEYVSAIEAKYAALKRQDKNAQLIVERRMRAPLLHPDFHGTGDTLMVTRDVLHVDDLKCGWKPVAVRNRHGRLNPQLGSYIILALAELGNPVTAFDFEPGFTGLQRINLTVHQPRVYDRPERISVTFHELKEFHNTVVDAIARVEAGDRTRKADPTWCRYCLARGRCPTARDAAVDRALEDFRDGVDNIPLADMAGVLAEADWLESQSKGAKESVFRALKVGRTVEGFKLVEKKARKSWTDFDRAVRIAESLGIPESSLYRRQPISPAQFITLVKITPGANAAIEWKMLDECYKQEPSGHNLVPADDPRPEVKIVPGSEFDEE